MSDTDIPPNVLDGILNGDGSQPGPSKPGLYGGNESYAFGANPTINEAFGFSYESNYDDTTMPGPSHTSTPKPSKSKAQSTKKGANDSPPDLPPPNVEAPFVMVRLKNGNKKVCRYNR